MKPLSYKDNWTKIASLGEGGQANTIKAKRNDGTGEVAAVKILKRNNDYERRLRAFREVAYLVSLEHPNIPKVIETNCDDYKNDNANLYVAIEFIPGATLSENVVAIPPTLEEIILTIIEITKIVQFCHKRGIIHRDLKPDNIILRNSFWNDPVIIDFGISFNNEALDDDALTPTGQHIGNRFLILPEHKVGESSKRDSRSDIAAIVGLLFYLITKKEPTILLDENNNKPHQRENNKKIINSYPDFISIRLNHIFDIGFNYMIDKRLQSTESLINALENLLNAKPNNDMDESKNLKKIKEALSNSDYQDLSFANKLFTKIDLHTRKVIETLSKELGEGFGNIQSGGIDMKEVVYRNMLGIINSINPNIFSKPTLHGFMTGSELVIQAIEDNGTKDLLRSPIENPNWDEYEENLRNYYIEGLSKRI